MSNERMTSPIVFISHRSTDAEVADMLKDFLVGTGIASASIFCSSLPGNDVGEKIPDEVKDAISSSVVNIVILSNSYYQSAYCLNEAGIIWYQENIPVIPIALPEINPTNMYGFLNSDYKLRRLDNDNDISYIYDKISESLTQNTASYSTITYESQKLKKRYNKFIETKHSTIIVNKTSTSISDAITTDDEKIVLYYVATNRTRKVYKDKFIDWLHKNELINVNMENAFDLISQSGFATTNDDNLEFNLEAFREFTSAPESTITELKSCVEKHVSLAANTFIRTWGTTVFNESVKLLLLYIIEERRTTLGDRWLTKDQLDRIKKWECKNCLYSNLSDNYETSLAFLVLNNFVYASSWTSHGNPREYSLYPSLQNLLFSSNDEIIDDLLTCKKENTYELPF